MKAEAAQQRSLLELSRIDADASRLDHRVKNLPEQQRFEAVQAEHGEANDRLATLDIALGDLAGQVSKFESDIDGVRKREDRDRALLDGGTVDVKHVAELQHELETLQRRQGSLEDSLLEIMERREVLEAERAVALTRIDELQSQLATAQAERDAVLAGIDQTKHQTSSRRDELVASLEPTLLAMYERQRARGGPGAAALQGRKCGACSIEIDRGEIARITAASEDELLHCPECGAILLRIRDFSQ